MQSAELSKSEWLIRPYQESDEAGVISMWHRSGLAAYPYLPTWQALTLEKAAHVFRTVIRPSCAIWVGVQDDLVVAYLAMQGSYIDRLYVDPPEWHKGWSRRLIRFAKQLSPAGLNCTRIKKTTRPGFYTRVKASMRLSLASARRPNPLRMSSITGDQGNPETDFE